MKLTNFNQLITLPSVAPERLCSVSVTETVYKRICVIAKSKGQTQKAVATALLLDALAALPDDSDIGPQVTKGRKNQA